MHMCLLCRALSLQMQKGSSLSWRICMKSDSKTPIATGSGGYSNSEARGKDFQKLMSSKKEKEL